MALTASGAATNTTALEAVSRRLSFCLPGQDRLRGRVNNYCYGLLFVITSNMAFIIELMPDGSLLAAGSAF